MSETFGTFGGPLPDMGFAGMQVGELTREEMVSVWQARLDLFCRALESASFIVDRPDALTVRITAPRAPEPAPGDA